MMLNFAIPDLAILAIEFYSSANVVERLRQRASCVAGLPLGHGLTDCRQILVLLTERAQGVAEDVVLAPVLPAGQPRGDQLLNIRRK